MKRRHFMIGGSAAFGAFATGIHGASAQPKTVKLDMSNEYAANSIHGVGDARFVKLVKEITNGQVDIVVHYGGSLGFKSKDHFDAVGDGALPIADTFAGALAGINPLFLAPSLPFLTRSVEEAKLLWETVETHLNKFFASNKQTLLYASPWPPSGIWAKTPIDSVAKLKGLKIRTYDKNGTTTLAQLGASAITMSWGDVVPAASSGSIEAVLASAEGGVSSKLYEFFPHFTEIFEYAYVMNVVHMNTAALEKLAPNHKQAVLEAARTTSAENWAAVPGRLKNTFAEMAQQKVTVTTSDSKEYAAALSQAGDAVIKEWLGQTGATGKAILDEYQAKVAAIRK